MILDKQTLIELQDYIECLDEEIGLKPETIIDLTTAINKKLDEILKIS